MAKTLTDVDIFDPLITVAEAGDARDAASVETSFQGLANRTFNSKGRLDALDLVLAKVPQLNTVTDLLVPLSAGYEETPAEYLIDGTVGFLQAVLGAGNLVFDITHLLPAPGEVIDTVTVYIKGTGGHTTGPTTKPRVRLVRYAKASGADTVIDTATDTLIGGDYEVDHTVSITGIAHTILADTRYTVLFRGEGGADSFVGMTLHAVELGWTV